MMTQQKITDAIAEIEAMARLPLNSLLSDIADTLPCMHENSTGERVAWLEQCMERWGYVIAPRKPTEATIDAMAREIDPVPMSQPRINLWRKDVERARNIARAAYRAAVEGGERDDGN